MSASRHCLVIGYGNTLRRDDGAGIEAALAIAAMNLPGVSVITRHQLVPELAAPISEADAVIFVDADAEATAEAELRPVEPAQSGDIMAHAADPRSLLALAERLFGRSPPAWTLGIPAEDFGFGDGLSARAKAALPAALAKVRKWTACR